MSLTGHFIDGDWKRQQVVLNVKAMEGSHTGEYISQTFLAMLEHWGISTDRVLLVLRDGGANMIKGLRLAELPDWSCSAHTLQLVVNDGLSSQRAVEDIVAILRRCATHFSHSVLAKQRLKAIQEQLGLPTHGLIQAVPTRWNSTLHMLQRMLEQKRALNVYGGEHGHVTCLSAAQWDIVANLLETLTPLEELTLEMSQSEASAACIIPTVTILKLMLQARGPSTTGIQTLRETMLKSVTKRFAKAEETKCLVLATLLDPRYKGHAFSSGETLDKAKEWLKEEAEADHEEATPFATQGGTSEEEGTDPKRPQMEDDQPSSLVDRLYAGLLGPHGQQDTAQAPNSLDEELDHYLGEPVIDRRSGQPLQWWKQNAEHLKTLAPLAKKFLCPPPSSVPSERVFSEVGAIYDKRRSRLMGENAEKLCFLHYNLQLLNWDY